VPFATRESARDAHLVAEVHGLAVCAKRSDGRCVGDTRIVASLCGSFGWCGDGGHDNDGRGRFGRAGLRQFQLRQHGRQPGSIALRSLVALEKSDRFQQDHDCMAAGCLQALVRPLGHGSQGPADGHLLGQMVVLHPREEIRDVVATVVCYHEPANAPVEGLLIDGGVAGGGYEVLALRHPADGGSILVREVEQQLGLLEAATGYAHPDVAIDDYCGVGRGGGKQEG